MSARLKSRSLLVTLYLMLAALLMSSCSVGPDYSRPPIPTPAAYKESMGVKLQSIDAVIGASWWEIFGDSDLNNNKWTSPIKISPKRKRAFARRVPWCKARARLTIPP